MTDATIALAGMAELADKGTAADIRRQMLQFMAHRLMDVDIENLCGAAQEERCPLRLNCRNGLRDRSWEARAGAVPLKIPKLRRGSRSPGFL